MTRRRESSVLCAECFQFCRNVEIKKNLLAGRRVYPHVIKMARQVLYAIYHFNGSLARSITVGVILFSLQFVLLRTVIVLKYIFLVLLTIFNFWR